MVDTTPNLQLDKIPANNPAWAERMNRNLVLIDATVGAYFALQNLQGVWENSHVYEVGQTVVDEESVTVWQCQVPHTSAMVGTDFATERAENPTFWTVYSSPARARGAWVAQTQYAVNDFVVAGNKYAVCIVSHTSSVSFDADVLDGKWSILVDLSGVGSQVLPALSGAADANKFVITTPAGTGYNIYDVAYVLDRLGVTSIGKALLAAVDASAGRSAINAQVAGSYQAADATLAALSGKPTKPYGVGLLNIADITELKSLFNFGTAAFVNAPASAIVGVDDAQTLTNKTLTNPVVGTQTQHDNSTKAASTAYVDRVGVQQVVTAATSAAATGTSVIPTDGTIPQQTEGDQYLSATITPKSATSLLVIEAIIYGSVGSLSTWTAALFQDSTANALTAGAYTQPSASYTGFITLRFVMTAGTTSATTFKVRAGTNAGGTLTVNGLSGVSALGAIPQSRITITEIGA